MSGDDLAEVFEGLEPGLAPPSNARKAAEVVSQPCAVSPAAPFARLPIPFEWANDLGDEIHAPRQIVEGVLTAGSLSVIYGESNSGKTYLALHLGICVSLGHDWLGKRTQTGTVVYIAAEGAWSIRTRIAAYRKHHKRPVGCFAIIPSTLNLMDPSADVDDLVALIEEEVQRGDRPLVSLIIVDTVARVMGGANENASEDMSRLVSAGDRIREATGAHVMFIHHSGKDAAKGARGHSSLRAAVDTEIEVTADETEHIHTAKITKQRDLASKGERIAGKFVSVEIGRDQWGGPVTACVVEPAEPSGSPARVRGTSPAQQAVLGYLAAQTAGVRRAKIVESLEPQGMHRGTIYRAINDLIEVNRIGDVAGMIYVPKS